MIFNVNSGAGKQQVNIVPSTNSVFTYDGSAKTPLWQNFNPEQLTISGADSATHAGAYTVYFTPKADYEWWDGTSTPKEVTWSIAKAAGSLSLSETSGTIVGKNSSAKTFTVTRAGDGEISVSSSNTAYATASVSGTTVTITPKGYGTATITVSVAAGTNHTAPSSKTYTITVNPFTILNTGGFNTTQTGAFAQKSSVTTPNVNGGNAASASIGSNNISMIAKNRNDTNSSVYVICSHSTDVDFTGYDRLEIEHTGVSGYSNPNNGSLSIGLSAAASDASFLASTSTVKRSTETVTLDISNINRKAYIKFQFNSYWFGDYSTTITKITLY